MLNRRNFLTAAGAGAATAVISCSSRGFAAPPDDAGSSGDGTWLTYAVNVEMTWGKLPFLDRLRKVKESAQPGIPSLVVLLSFSDEFPGCLSPIRRRPSAG